jgi:hypothetical protein
MKKLIATLSLAALATGAFAQGFVTIANGGGSTAMYTVSGGVSNLTSKTASAYYYDVLVNASTVTTIDASLQGVLASGWSDAGLTGGNNTGLGTGGKITAGNTQANFWPIGNEMSAVVVGWSGSIGTTLASALAAINGATLTKGANGAWTGGNLLAGQYVGFTTVAQAFSGPDAGTAAALFLTAPTSGTPLPISGTTSLFTVNVPEPGTMALAGLGVASLLIFRRRK